MGSLSLNTAWTEGSAFVRREAGLLAPAMLLFIAVPFAAILLALPPELKSPVPGNAPVTVTLSPVSLAVIVVGSLMMFTGSLVGFALSLRPGISLREALALALRRLPVALGAAIIAGVLAALPVTLVIIVSQSVGALLLVAATFFITTRLLFLNAVVVDSSLGPVNALVRSWGLTRNNFLILFLFVVVISVVIMLAKLAAQLALGLPALALAGQEIGQQAGDFGGAIVVALGQMYAIAVTARLYRQRISAQ